MPAWLPLLLLAPPVTHRPSGVTRVTVQQRPSSTASLCAAHSRFHLSSTAISVSQLHNLPCPSSHPSLVPRTAEPRCLLPAGSPSTLHAAFCFHPHLPALRLAPFCSTELLCTCSTNNRRTSSTHVYLSTIWAGHLPFAVSPAGHVNQANWPHPPCRWQPEAAISMDTVSFCVYLSKSDHSLKYSQRLLYIISYNLYHCTKSYFEQDY